MQQVSPVLQHSPKSSLFAGFDGQQTGDSFEHEPPPVAVVQQTSFVPAHEPYSASLPAGQHVSPARQEPPPCSIGQHLLAGGLQVVLFVESSALVQHSE